MSTKEKASERRLSRPERSGGRIEASEQASASRGCGCLVSNSQLAETSTGAATWSYFQTSVENNRGSRTRERVPPPRFPSADAVVREQIERRPAGAVDILLVNPPAPDGGIWIRSQHRVGRRSREGMIWPQVSLAQMAALFPDYRVEVVDAIATRMGWPAFERLLREKQPRYYVTQVTAPTLQNDMVGCFLARSLGATTIAFGTHVTPMPVETMERYPALDYVLRGEPELTLRELVDTLSSFRFQVSGARRLRRLSRPQGGRIETKKPLSGEGERQNAEGPTPWAGLAPAFRQRLDKLFREADPEWQPAWRQPFDCAQGKPPTLRLHSGQASNPSTTASARPPLRASRPPFDYGLYEASAQGKPLPSNPSTALRASLQQIKGLVWRQNGQIVINEDRPFIRHLDDLPLPRHELLPLSHYRAPLVGGPYAFVVTSRGCPAGCRFCIKHVSYGNSLRLRSPENVLAEIEQLVDLGVYDIHMYADLFTASRDQVMGICEGVSHLIEETSLPIRWTCNSRVDFVDEEMLQAMGRSGCWLISWGIESGSQEILRRVRKGFDLAQAHRALQWARDAGIKNWGYFIIGLPGETEETIEQTIALAKELPLDLALFHIAAPHPGTPFFFEVVEKGWFRPGTRWEQVDMDRSTVLQYSHMPAGELEHWARVAFRRWAFRPGPIWTFAKMLFGSPRLLPMAVQIGLESIGWGFGR